MMKACSSPFLDHVSSEAKPCPKQTGVSVTAAERLKAPSGSDHSSNHTHAPSSGSRPRPQAPSQMHPSSTVLPSMKMLPAIFIRPGSKQETCIRGRRSGRRGRRKLPGFIKPRELAPNAIGIQLVADGKSRTPSSQSCDGGAAESVIWSESCPHKPVGTE